MKLIDAQGKEVSRTSANLAVQELGDGTFRVFRREPDDVRALVAGLKAAGAKDEHLLTEDYWMNHHPCRLVGIAECEGDCPDGGVCTVVFEHFFYACRCKHREPIEIGPP